MENLPPIPSPPGTLLKEFRVRVLPFAMFAVVCAATLATWRSYVGPSSLVGQVEAVQAVVSSPQPGRVINVRVGHLQHVNKGDPLVQILTTDPKILEAQLAVNRARIDFIRSNVDQRLRKENNLISFEGFRLDGMQKRVDLAMARTRLIFNENEFQRVDQLFRGNSNNIASIRDFEVAKRDVELARAQVSEFERLVNQAAAIIRELEPSENKIEDDTSNSVRAAVSVEERQLGLIEAQLAPITLTAPIEGVVAIVHHRDGESIVAGEPILTLSSTHSDRIVAYLRAPLYAMPEIGQSVEVRSRSNPKNPGRGEIRAVGATFEVINAELLPVGSPVQGRPQRGLPLVISIPLEGKFYPGEIVDLNPERN